MMKNLIIFIFFVSCKVFATPQIPDKLIYNGKEYEWNSFSPGHKYIEDKKNAELQKFKLKNQLIEEKKEKFIEVYEKLGSDIFTKYGWVQIISKELKISHTHIRIIMKSYFPESFLTAYFLKFFLRSNYFCVV